MGERKQMKTYYREGRIIYRDSARFEYAPQESNFLPMRRVKIRVATARSKVGAALATRALNMGRDDWRRWLNMPKPGEQR